jgi:FkbM family methyltransferase
MDGKEMRGVITRLLKVAVRHLFNLAGLEIRRINPASDDALPRESVRHTLEQARRIGLMPRTVIDVGAAYGAFTRLCHPVFPAARYLLIEPLEEYRPLLDEARQVLTSVEYTIAAASFRDGEVAINVHPDLVGSSVYREIERGTGVNGMTRAVRSITVDRLVREAGATGPFLLKIDVQGAELDVLEGAERTLIDTGLVVLEVSFFKFFENGPECADIIAYMKTRGFVPYDIVARQYRPLDGALSQADIAFVKEDGLFRRHHFYATPEQRDAQNQQMQRYLNELFTGQCHD